MLPMLKPRHDNCTDINDAHWAYTWGLEVAAGTRLAPGNPGLKSFDRFSPRDRWHYGLGLAAQAEVA